MWVNAVHKPEIGKIDNMFYYDCKNMNSSKFHPAATIFLLRGAVKPWQMTPSGLSWQYNCLKEISLILGWWPTLLLSFWATELLSYWAAELLSLSNWATELLSWNMEYSHMQTLEARPGQGSSSSRHSPGRSTRGGRGRPPAMWAMISRSLRAFNLHPLFLSMVTIWCRMYFKWQL